MKLFGWGISLTVVLTIVSGVVQGVASNRWGTSAFQRQAGARLASFPEKFGDWEMKRAEKLGPDELAQLEPYGYFQRVYGSRGNGASFNVTLLLGPAGPLSVHTPEVCYAGRDHEQLGERRKIELPRADGGAVWKTTFRLKGVDGQRQDIYYAWSAGERWSAAENPRLSFAGRPYLYKMQLACTASAADAPDDPAGDPAVQFLREFIPALQPYLQTPATK
jgi:hypothetical protein